jgi:hypothetical protein
VSRFIRSLLRWPVRRDEHWREDPSNRGTFVRDGDGARLDLAAMVAYRSLAVVTVHFDLAGDTARAWHTLAYGTQAQEVRR